MENRSEKLLRLWKARQEAEGHDVSGVKTLEEAEHFFDKKPEHEEIATPVSEPARNDGEGTEETVAEDEEVIDDGNCDLDSVDEPI